MRKLFILMLSFFLIETQGEAQSIIGFDVHYDDPSPIGHLPEKSPIQPPTVYIQDYTLTFTVDHPEYVLYIKDENDVVVYTTTVYSTDTQVVLPSTLSGEYKIELVMGNWLFTGYLIL